MPRLNTHIGTRAIALLGALALLSIAAPAAANTPERTTEHDTTIRCESVANEAGVIRFAVGSSDLGGPSGFLIYLADPNDLPTLVSDGVDVAIGADGSITATFDMYLPGDLGLEGDPEPIFVGTAELVAYVEPTGDVEQILSRNQNGNQRTVITGGRQGLAITGGEVTVPTAGSFDLPGTDCSGRQQVTEIVSTQPNADVSTGHLIQVDCFFETADGFIAVSGQSGETETYVMAIIVDGADVYFGEASAPRVDLRGVQASIALPMDGDPSVVATANVSGRFSVVERAKGRFETDSGWATETAYLFAVNGTVSVDAPGISAELPMDGCFANAQIGIGHSH